MSVEISVRFLSRESGLEWEALFSSRRRSGFSHVRVASVGLVADGSALGFVTTPWIYCWLEPLQLEQGALTRELRRPSCL